METASFTGVVKTICMLVVIYYAIVFLMRLLAPVLVQQVVKKATQNFNQQYNQQQEQQQQYSQQSYSAPRQKQAPKANPNKKVGEYIEFEELD